MNKEMKRIIDNLLERFDYHEIDDIILDLEEYTTPPTEENVCKALSEWFKSKVTFDKETMNFYWYKDIGMLESVPVVISLDKLDFYAKYDLITMIGGFCEGMDDNNE